MSTITILESAFNDLPAFIENESDMAVWVSDTTLYAYRAPCTSSALEDWEAEGCPQESEPRGLVLALPYWREA